jgi:anthranilate phosphoribosyltransferase
MLVDAIQKLVDRIDLSEEEAREAMGEIMAGQATDAQIGAFLTALRMKGEAATELVGFARVMREKAEPFWDGEILPVLDTAGTGGDNCGTFNISTAAALVIAAAGVRVAKHGNRSRTGCGSAEVMEALGIDIQLPIDQLRHAVKNLGYGFFFAQRFHSSMKHVAPARAQLKMRTVFNILGPLANPARAAYQVVGVFSAEFLELMATALQGLGVQHAFVVHGHGGVDEISVSGPTQVVETHRGERRSYTIAPEYFGVAVTSTDSLRGGTAADSAAIIERIFAGEKGPRRDVVLMNAAPGLVAGGAASTLKEGFKLAADAIDSGAVLQKLQALRELKK